MCMYNALFFFCFFIRLVFTILVTVAVVVIVELKLRKTIAPALINNESSMEEVKKVCLSQTL